MYFLLNDRQNSVRDVIDASGNVKDAITYTAFGTVASETDVTYRGWYAWTGMETDQQTGLQYNNARWYNAAIGTWMTQDPMGFDAGDSNLYRYVNNAPTNHTDPSGFVSDNVGLDNNFVQAKADSFSLKAVSVEPPAPGVLGSFFWAISWELNQKSDSDRGGTWYSIWKRISTFKTPAGKF